MMRTFGVSSRDLRRATQIERGLNQVPQGARPVRNWHQDEINAIQDAKGGFFFRPSKFP